MDETESWHVVSRPMLQVEKLYAPHTDGDRLPDAEGAEAPVVPHDWMFRRIENVSQRTEGNFDILYYFINGGLFRCGVVRLYYFERGTISKAAVGWFGRLHVFTAKAESEHYDDAVGDLAREHDVF